MIDDLLFSGAELTPLATVEADQRLVLPRLDVVSELARSDSVGDGLTLLAIVEADQRLVLPRLDVASELARSDSVGDGLLLIDTLPSARPASRWFGAPIVGAAFFPS